MPTKIDTSYRTWPKAELEAVKVSVLTQLKNIEGQGQGHSLNGRNTNLADFDKLTDKLASINAALDYLTNSANRGNKGYASRYASFNNRY